MKTKEVINLETVLGSDIRTRGRIKELIRLVHPDKEYIIDFSQVKFISRSFADELISYLEYCNGRLECINMTDDIMQLMTIVRHSRTASNSSQPLGDVKQLRTMEELTAFFEAI